MSENLSLPDYNMIQLMEYAVTNGLAESEGAFWDQIGFTRTGITAVRKGVQSFRVKHITEACRVTGVSADWVLGLDRNMFRDTKGKTAIQLLKEATALLESQMKRKKNTLLLF